MLMMSAVSAKCRSCAVSTDTDTEAESADRSWAVSGYGSTSSSSRSLVRLIDDAAGAPAASASITH